MRPIKIFITIIFISLLTIIENTSIIHHTYGQELSEVFFLVERVTAVGVQPVDFSIVDGVTPTIQIRTNFSGNFRIFNDRLDGRAGINGGPNGFGKEISHLFVEIEPGVWQAYFDVLVGVNAIVITDEFALSILASATMLNYSLSYEDLNGNQKLDYNEDINGNSTLDVEEDSNGNQIADFAEDINENSLLDLNEDLNRNGIVDPDEDLNKNNEIDPVVQTIFLHQAEDDVISDPYLAIPIHDRSLLLEFVPDTPLHEISTYLREKQLKPLGISFSYPHLATPHMVIVEVPSGVHAFEMERQLNGLLVSDGIFPSLFMPVDFPLNVAIVNMTMDLRETAGEKLPTRLYTGEHPNKGEGYDPVTGGFDHDGDNMPDELNIFWHHFFLDTFAAHGLIEVVTKNAANLFDKKPGLAIVDTGLGDGTHNGVSDYEGVPLFGITNCDSGMCMPSHLKDIPDTKSHGTKVTFFAAGDGRRILGTALPYSNSIRVRPIKAHQSLSVLCEGLRSAAFDPRVHVINLSQGLPSPDSNNDGVFSKTERKEFESNIFPRYQHLFLSAIQPLEDHKKIMMIAANEWNLEDLDVDYDLALFNVPVRFVRHRTLPGAHFMGIGATSRGSALTSKEGYAFFSQESSSISVSAPGDLLVGESPERTLITNIRGTSYAAPQVAGLAAQLLGFNRIPVLGDFDQFQVVETIEATADDLGTPPADHPDYPDNLTPGDGPDSRFGWGRINVWKAVLSRLNKGLAQESHPRSSHFQSLSRISESQTKWYGFRIITHVKDATVWLNGVQLEDGIDMPNSPWISAYKGIYSGEEIRMGIPHEDPTSGVIPVGNNGGEYVITFSIEKKDLFDTNGKPKTLSLRKKFDSELSPPFFNLKFDLERMRLGEIPGITFDDFVFEMTPPDFGDAPDSYPTILDQNGARHSNSNIEWLGKPDRLTIQSVSPEHDAIQDEDPDGVSNNRYMPWGKMGDLDRFDDGVVFYPLTYRSGEHGKLEFTPCVADPNSGRYQKKNLFVNGWIDWNTNGIWEEGDEHIVDGVGIRPFNRQWTISFKSRNATSITQKEISTSGHCATFKADFIVPEIGEKFMWARFRLDYHEDVGRFSENENLNLTQGAAQFGEVEDYLIGADFGDARDPHYPTRKESQGARHLDIYKEWFGASRTRETDACDETTAEQDRIPNLGPHCSFPDQDGGDHGVIVPKTVLPGQKITLPLEISTSIAMRGYDQPQDPSTVISLGSDCEKETFFIPPTPFVSRGKGRYAGTDSRKILYLNAWADWNINGTWEKEEKIFDSLPIAPETFGKDGMYTLGEPFRDLNRSGVRDSAEPFDDVAGISSKIFKCKITVPPHVKQGETFFWRFRLDYGENTSTFVLDNAEMQEDDRTLQQEKGGALFGEVEDYSSFYPRDPIKYFDSPNRDPHNTAVVTTDTTIRYTVILPAPQVLNTETVGWMRDSLPAEVEFAGNLQCTSGICNYNSDTRTVTWNGTVIPHDTVVVEFDAKATIDKICGPGGTPLISTFTNFAEVFDGITTHKLQTTCTVQCTPITVGSVKPLL